MSDELQFVACLAKQQTKLVSDQLSAFSQSCVALVIQWRAWFSESECSRANFSFS